MIGFRTRWLLAVAGLGSLVAGCSAAHAQSEHAAMMPASAPETPAAEPALGPTPARSEVDPEALALLTNMGAFLREQRAFAVRSRMQTDEVLESGQKILLTSTGRLDVRRPNRLRAEVKSDRKHREFFYDGKSFTIHAPRMGYYATVDAPTTIAELIEVLTDRFGIELPLVDLFYWGTDQDRLDAITSAINVGPSTIQDAQTDHLAFRQPGLDWQLWIERGARPLPRKLVLTTTDDPARPQHTVELDWDLAPKYEHDTFSFVPTRSSKRIVLTPADARR
jgi:hypothetical protein